MSDSNAQEPTMEEILASIRRIISEDDAPAAAPEQTPPPAVSAAAPAAAPASEAPPPPAPPEPPPAPTHMSHPEPDNDEDILELTEPLDAPPAPVPPFGGAHESLGDLDVFSSTPTPEPRPMPSPTSSPDSSDGLLVSGSTAHAAASAFGQLTGLTTMPAEGRTLEDFVREMLRPLLKDWLDANLPAIVESTVRAEVERISRSRVY